MDKYEYKIRSDEIMALIAEGEFAEAVSIADTIDWRRVKSIKMLCTISDLYKINRRYQESKEILLLAYERHPTGRSIVYSLCELSIKLEEYVQAIEYYKEFAQIAPKDTGRYILQYRLYEAQDVSLEERIAVLEEFKKRDPREKWEYELAYLYHRIGLSTKCIEICDEMFFMFGDGKYVIKALELKALHEPLSTDQQAKYDAWIWERSGAGQPEEEDEEEDDMSGVSGDTRVVGKVRHTEEEDGQEMSMVPTMELPEVKTVDVGQYNTINLQMALAESMKEILEDNGAQAEAEYTDDSLNIEEIEDVEDVEFAAYADDAENTEGIADTEDEETVKSVAYTGDVETAAESEETFIEEEPEEAEENIEQPSIAETLIAPLLEETAEMPATNEIEKELRETPVIAFPANPQTAEEDVKPDKKLTMDTGDLQEISAQIAQEDTVSFDAEQIVEQMKQEAQRNLETFGGNQIPKGRTDVLTPLNAKSSKFDHILAQEYDGQISLVMPEAERVEKQITGQLSIEDIMVEWEEMKKTNEHKRMEEVKQRILAHTGNLFADFDEATKNGLLEELERAFIAAIMKDSGKKSAIKNVVLPEDEAEKKTETKRLTPEMEKIIEAALHDTDEELPEEEPEDEAEESVEPEEEILSETEDIPEKTAAAESAVEEQAVSRDQETPDGHGQDRELTQEESELFGQFAHHRKSKRQLVHTLDNMSLASCTGNVVITGEEESATLTLAKALIKEMQYNDKNFSGKIAKISGNVLNKKDVAETFGRLDNGALIIEKASRLKPPTVAKMTRVLEKDNMGLLLLMIDKKQNINQLLADNAVLNNNFNLRVDIEPLDDEALVNYAKQYAEELEYSIDEFGILALHTRIADRQTSDHEVSMSEVRELVDEAIYYANKKTPRHFMDILLAKRYDEEDMIILREKDFMHY
ncbi:MAG: hypothetical protein HDR28_09100 [Lachnospiraceae bacterium]|nr:hypothetical protein [Lachnospiraceae bacterium]